MRDDVKAISLVWLSKTGLTNLNSGEGGSNYVDVKKYDYLGKSYPYVSGQAMRFYLKEAIRRVVAPEEACAANDEGHTCGDIQKCVLCDLFGFLTTIKAKGSKKGESIPRVSPVKVSPAMGLLPFEDNSVVDFLTRRPRERVITEEGEGRNIVNVELGVNIYKSGITIDVAKIGREEVIRDQPTEITYADKAYKGTKRTVSMQSLIPTEEKQRRIQLLLHAVKTFSDYSKQARLLTDFTPDLLLAAVQPSYSHRLQKALELRDEQALDLQRLNEILDELTAEESTLFAGAISGVVSNHDDVIHTFQERGIWVNSPAAVIERVLDYISG